MSHHATQEGNIRTRIDPQMNPRILGNRRLPGINDDHRCSPIHSLIYFAHDDGVALCRIGADDQDTLCPCQIGDGVCHGAATRCLAHTHSRGGMAQTRAVIHIIRLEGHADHLLEKVILLIGALGGRQPAYGIPAVSFGNCLQFLSRQGYGFAPGDLLKPFSFSDKRGLQSIGMMNEFMRRPALDAEGAATDRVFPVRVGADNLAVLDLQNQAAADSAIGTNCFDKIRTHRLFSSCLPSPAAPAPLQAPCIDRTGSEISFPDQAQPRNHRSHGASPAWIAGGPEAGY